jgi:hypothetical protein
MMNTRCALWLTMVLAMAGCRTPDPSVDLLEGELRWLEDQLYQAEDEYRLKCAQLASCRRENQTLRKAASKGARGATLQPLDGASSSPEESPERSAPSEDIPELRIPSVEPGEPVDPRIELPEFDTMRLDPELKTTSGTTDTAVDNRVTHIVLNPRLTGGHNFDEKAGDEGLMIVVEPRNADGEYVEFSGPVSVVVLDPSKTGPEARVARWDYDATEIAGLMRRSLLGKGIHLELPWPNQPPEHDSLRVFVRYTTGDGRQLQADRRVDVDPPASHLGRWTPASRPSSHDSNAIARAVASSKEAKADLRSVAGTDIFDSRTPTASPLVPKPTAMLPHHDGAVYNGDDAATDSARLTAAESGSLPSRLSRRPRPTWRPYR